MDNAHKLDWTLQSESKKVIGVLTKVNIDLSNKIHPYLFPIDWNEVHNTLRLRSIGENGMKNYDQNLLRKNKRRG